MNRLNYTLVTLCILLTGCGQKYDASSDEQQLNSSGNISMEKYKEKYDWIKLDDNRVITPFIKLHLDSVDYDKALSSYGTPVFEYTDTVVKGMNIKNNKPDFDLYPLTLDKDTVVVKRCWWLKTYSPNRFLYVVFRMNDSISIPIYGYYYRPSMMNEVGDNYERWSKSKYGE